MNLIEALSVFGISTTSGETQVSLKKRYRKLAKDRHPDRTGGGSEEFIALQEAYVLLKREVKDTGDSFPGSQAQEENASDSVIPNGSSNDRTKGYVVVDQEDIAQMKQEAQPEYSGSKELKALSKDELLEKYYNDTTDLQKKLGSLMNNYELHRSVLGVVEKEVSQLSDDYRQEMNKLQSRYQKEIDKLQKNALYRVWVRYFLTPITGKDIWARYRDNVSTYEQERQKKRAEFNDKLLLIYGESLNEMSRYLTSSPQE